MQETATSFQPDMFQADFRPPPLRHSITELGRVFLEMGSSAMLGPVFKRLPAGDGHSIMTIPGFMGADGSTAQLRRFLKKRGYNPIPWGEGRNAAEVSSDSIEDFLEHRTKMEEIIAEKAERECRASGQKVTLIGWSLGGLYAVAVAHRYPRWIRQVVTLGTPFGDPRGTALYRIMDSMQEEDHPDEEGLRRWVEHTYRGGKLKVPVLALFSESDGIVGTGIARCQGDPRYVTNMAVMASHVGFPFNPIVFAVIANHLVAPEERWSLCQNEMIRPLARLA